MKQSTHKRLQKLEQLQTRRASVRPASNAIEKVRAWLRARGVEQQPEESLAETYARALGISTFELRERLGRRACAQ